MKKLIPLLCLLLASCTQIDLAIKDKAQCDKMWLFSSPTVNSLWELRYVCVTLFQHCSMQTRNAIQDLNDTWGSRDNMDTPSKTIKQMVDDCMKYEKQ